MLEAIRFLHEKGKKLHRDIKPDNFRVHNGNVKLIDFGLSFNAPEEGSQ